jgi:hypothetical protein
MRSGDVLCVDTECLLSESEGIFELCVVLCLRVVF